MNTQINNQTLRAFFKSGISVGCQVDLYQKTEVVFSVGNVGRVVIRASDESPITITATRGDSNEVIVVDSLNQVSSYFSTQAVYDRLSDLGRRPSLREACEIIRNALNIGSAMTDVEVLVVNGYEQGADGEWYRLEAELADSED